MVRWICFSWETSLVNIRCCKPFLFNTGAQHGSSMVWPRGMQKMIENVPLPGRPERVEFFLERQKMTDNDRYIIIIDLLTFICIYLLVIAQFYESPEVLAPPGGQQLNFITTTMLFTNQNLVGKQSFVVMKFSCWPPGGASTSGLYRWGHSSSFVNKSFLLVF